MLAASRFQFFYFANYVALSVIFQYFDYFFQRRPVMLIIPKKFYKKTNLELNFHNISGSVNSTLVQIPCNGFLSSIIFIKTQSRHSENESSYWMIKPSLSKAKVFFLWEMKRDENTPEPLMEIKKILALCGPTLTAILGQWKPWQETENLRAKISFQNIVLQNKQRLN